MPSLQGIRRTDVNLRSGAQMREYRKLAERIARDRPGRLLDWGCGWGQMTKLLRDRGVDAEPFDYRPGEPAPGRAQLERFPELECGFSPDPVALPYDDASFDAALSCGVLEHVQDPHGSLEELRRVLRAGGRLYVIKLPNRTSYLEWIAKRIGMYHHGQLEHDTIYTPSSARSLVAGHGFEVTAVRRANMLPLTLDHRLASRLSGAIWALSRLLEHVPLLNRLATNVEVYAIRS